MEEWKTKKADAAYLLESGLLFEINRSIMHPVGLAMVVSKDEKGNFILVIKDGRLEPENLKFNKEVYQRGNDKLIRFMRDFGHGQMERRSKKLGWSSQSWFVPEGKRYQ